MLRRAGFLMLFVCLGCGGADRASATFELSDGGRGDAGMQVSDCSDDADCPRGMVCEGCPGTALKQCTPGCRDNSQCNVNFICSTAVLCTTCPCPPGWCDLDPCRDLDGDGFAFTSDPNLTCSRPKGDCDDSRRDVHPGGREVCADGADNDCDGKRDSRDDECRTCAVGQNACANARWCSSNQQCVMGCCEACPTYNPPQCQAGECLLPGGTSEAGCALPLVCGACASCPSEYRPVCGLNYSTYTNACYAQAAGTQVLHEGTCSYREGTACTSHNECSGLYCRRLSPDAGIDGDGRCTQRGACVTDQDCADGVVQTAFCADGGIAPLTCKNLRCATKCE